MNNTTYISAFKRDYVEYTIIKIPVDGDLVIRSCPNTVYHVCCECMNKMKIYPTISHVRFLEPFRTGIKYWYLQCKYNADSETDEEYYDNFQEVKEWKLFPGNVEIIRNRVSSSFRRLRSFRSNKQMKRKY